MRPHKTDKMHWPEGQEIESDLKVEHVDHFVLVFFHAHCLSDLLTF